MRLPVQPLKDSGSDPGAPADGALWTDEQLAALRTRHGFRLRGTEITRLESLTDGAFALALTFLVVAANEVPHSYRELMAAFKQAPAFAASFAVMLAVWSSHLSWSRRYGLEDGTSIALTGCLIFVMLIFVLPLKIIFAAWFSYLSKGWLPSSTQIESMEQLREIFIAYGCGFALLQVCMYGLYAHAERLAGRLSLNPLERLETRYSIYRCGMYAAVGGAGTALALLLPADLAPLSGYCYMTLALFGPWLRVKQRRARRALPGPPSSHPL